MISSILLLKSYSAGIGDLLRASAAWRALHDAYPNVRLHLWLLTREMGAPSETLIRHHHLLSGFHVSSKNTRHWRDWKQLFQDAGYLAKKWRPDLIVDFEPNGLRTSLLGLYLRHRSGATSLGIAQVPLRSLFYSRSSPSVRAYAQTQGLKMPLEFCHRDFVALAALGVKREGRPIELQETDQARACRQRLLDKLGGPSVRPLLGLNIGCGSYNAYDKRPHYDLLAPLINQLQQRHGFTLVLTGAPDEVEINRDFVRRLSPAGPLVDLAGQTDLLELTGVIAACRLFISSDSGPYHMAVGLRVPTLAIFNYQNFVHFHDHPWVQCVFAPDPRGLPQCLAAAEHLLQAGRLGEGSSPVRSAAPPGSCSPDNPQSHTRLDNLACPSPSLTNG